MRADGLGGLIPVEIPASSLGRTLAGNLSGCPDRGVQLDGYRAEAGQSLRAGYCEPCGPAEAAR